MLGEEALLRAKHYNRLLDSPAPRQDSSDEGLSDPGQIDLKQIEALAQEKAEDIVRVLVDYALSHMRLHFGQAAASAAADMLP